MRLYCNEKWIGSLRPTGSMWRLEFTQGPALPLSPHLVGQKNAVIESSAVQNFFVNYLPEEPFAERVAARITPRPRTFEDWFHALGQELTGAYALTPEAQEPSPVEYMPLPEKVLGESLQTSRSRADAIAFTVDRESSLPRLSLAGAQDKFALWFDPIARQPNQRFKVPKGRAASTHIFKPESTDTRYPMLPANEFACTQLASVLGLSAARTAMMTIGGVRTLVSERFDRERRGLAVKRLHQIDLCQMLNLPRERKYGSHNAGVDTEHFFEGCAYLRVPAIARRTHLRAWLFNFLIGNQDAHAKNYSFLYQEGWQTAPLYDLLCVLPYLPEQSLSMGLLNEYRAGWYEQKHWLSLAKLAGVSSAYLSEEINKMVEGVKAAKQPMERLLRSQLTSDELDFLAQRVNPRIMERTQLLQDAATSLRHQG
jgi:serine/threonine-protein kinase HipA